MMFPPTVPARSPIVPRRGRSRPPRGDRWPRRCGVLQSRPRENRHEQTASRPGGGPGQHGRLARPRVSQAGRLRAGRPVRALDRQPHRPAGGLGRRAALRRLRHGAGRAEAGRRLDQHLAEHARPFALRAIEAGAHVFIEKPLAETVEAAQAVVDAAVQHRKELVVGYILRVHPSWTKFIEIARTLGKPLVMRMNLNQQSVGPGVELAPQPDGEHDAAGRLRRPLRRRDVPDDASRPVRVHGIGAKLSRPGEGRQLRPAARRVRGRLGRLVRGRLGADDERGRRSS